MIRSRAVRTSPSRVASGGRVTRSAVSSSVVTYSVHSGAFGSIATFWVAFVNATANFCGSSSSSAVHVNVAPDTVNSYVAGSGRKMRTRSNAIVGVHGSFPGRRPRFSAVSSARRRVRRM